MATNEGVTDAVAVVLAFNDAINRREISALAELMTTTHRFIDSTGAVTHGKDACVAAWRAFFDSFSDYRNVFEDVDQIGEGIVVVRGRSECSTPALEGPAEWRVLVLGGQVDVWQVSERSHSAQ